MTNGNGNGQWQKVAFFLAGIIIAGFPAAFVSLTGPSKTDVQAIQKELVSAQLQIARIEERLVAGQESNADAIAQLQLLLQEYREGQRTGVR